MKLLFVHQNFPGQYKHLAPALAAQGHEVRALGMTERVDLPGVQYQRYGTRRASTKGLHPWVVDFEAKVIRGEACAQAARRLRESGFVPDLICVHPGWGEALLLREVWPEARQLHYVEFFYGTQGRDVGFDPEFPLTDAFEAGCRLSIKNTNNLLNLGLMDWGISPTQWQRATLPAAQQGRISVIHDGIDTAALCPDEAAVLEVTDDQGRPLRLTRADRVVTFVNRNLEPSRGYHAFMRSLPTLLARDPQVRVLLIGGDGVSYGAAPPAGSWKQIYLDEVAGRIDAQRVHFLGKVPYATYLAALRVSSAHVYLTYPFVLSWSLIEAMSLGAPIIASDTPPVREAIEHGRNGWLVDFFDAEALAERMLTCLADPAGQLPLRATAREDAIRRYDLRSVCLPAQLALVQSVARGERPDGAAL
ncbi:glycosyltransferase [Sphaerotilus microaerophilus]|uniref:Glycosyl transferase n=1 Tax=Sphaerotilus microaerophilus TaxID=2914710 RepID=A0ABM7YH54_9BURK|nr:glycosyltransferase [Sphaerotilus sp. FB-5]BDI03639.1 glycosyl transferase [Sphaerotilus sp. FB-5]